MPSHSPDSSRLFPRGLRRLALICCACLVFLPSALAAGGGAAGDNLLWLATILIFARLFAPLAEKAGMPAVLGELLLGVVLGNMTFLGIQYFEAIKTDPMIAFVAELGVIILLLQIGLETRLSDLMRVGGKAMLVATVGIAVPFALGYYIGPELLPGKSDHAYLFLGATLAATSVGITGRVFRDLGCLKSAEAQIVLGAAVIDDVLGLIILAVVSSLVREGDVSFLIVATITLKAVLFLGGSIFIGRMLARRLSRWLARLDNGHAMLFAQILSTGLFLAWLAHLVGLAPIVGAFAAGLLYEPLFLKDFALPKIVQEVKPLLHDEPGIAKKLKGTLERYTHHQHERMIEHFAYFFVPVFFVLTGMQVDLHTLLQPEIFIVALGISVVAIAGKLVAGFVAGRGVNHWVIGWGMVPRGEVGLIFAMVGRQLGVMTEAMFSVIVIMVIVTTLCTPPILNLLLRRENSRAEKQNG